ncbi:MAG TPA: hypothetical protein VL361_22540 [Candidatus Limnocylindrales bacterium]|nr:hypothetical protein [Candidatus Limnocylindrales bacterium]
MKIRVPRKAKELASALMVSLVICSILSLFVMYYLSLIEQQNILNARSQTWNMAIATSEAGVEEGLQQLNAAYPDLSGDGWTYNGASVFSKSNSLPDGSGYMAWIIVTNSTAPTVIARAYVTPPSATYWQTAAMILFATQGQTDNSSQAPVTRAVQVICNKLSPFNGALIARKNIDLAGNNVTTDSFDSGDPFKSVSGQYTPSFFTGDKGDIATNLGIVNSISGGNANIFGHAHTGPGSANNAVQVGSNGYIGSHADYPIIGSGIDPGWWLDDANFTFPETSYPDTSSYLTPTNGWITNMTAVVGTNTTTSAALPLPLPTVILQTNTTYLTGLTVPPALGTYTSFGSYKDKGNTYYWEYQITSYTYISSYTTNMVPVGTYYDHILWGSAGVTNNYVASDLSGSTYVTGPNVVLALPTGLNEKSGDTFTIGTDGSVIIYSGGTTCNIGGNGFVNNAGYAIDLLIFCAPTVTTLSYSGNAGFKGVIVAPSADVQLGGSGNNVVIDFTGCFMANSIKLNGHFNFHYDEALSGFKGFGRFLILSWNEIK